MSVYNVYIRNGPDSINVDIPDIYRDSDSETNSEQIRDFLCKTLNLYNESISLDVKRKNRFIRKVNNFTIIDNDELYFYLNNNEYKIDLSLLEMNTGFHSQGHADYSVSNFKQSYLDKTEKILQDYYDKLNVIINDIKSVNSNDKILLFIDDLIINTISYTSLPDHFPVKVMDNLWLFCSIKNGIIDNNGFCYDHINKIYYEGYFKDDKILYARCLNIKEQYFSTCDMFVNLLECAKGKKYSFDGVERYEGFFHEGLYSGGGFLLNNLGSYHGMFRNGKYNGYGCMIYKTGDIYVGYWYEDKYNIFGKLIFKNGDYYSGTWKDGKKEIYGYLYDHKTNTTYSGTFKDDKRTFNKNEFTVLDGKQFSTDIIGEYSIDLQKDDDSIKQKYFNILYQHGKLLISDFKNNEIKNNNDVRQKFYIGHYDFTYKIHGYGKLFFNASKEIVLNKNEDTVLYSNEYFENRYKGFRVYHSLFSNGCPNGHGMIEFENGDRYIGEIQDGQVTGIGTIFKKDGTCVKGFFNHNNLIYSL